jgi:hypothetical protein
MAYKTVYTEVEVDVDMADFDTDDLLDELELRGHMVDRASQDVVQSIYQKRRLGMDYQLELDELIYLCLGKIV